MVRLMRESETETLSYFNSIKRGNASSNLTHTLSIGVRILTNDLKLIDTFVCAFYDGFILTLEKKLLCVL